MRADDGGAPPVREAVQLGYDERRLAARRECARIRVLSNIVRERAHGSYARAGYDLAETESVFEKRL